MPTPHWSTKLEPFRLSDLEKIARALNSRAALVKALEDRIEELSEAVRAMDSWDTHTNEALEGADDALARFTPLPGAS